MLRPGWRGLVRGLAVLLVLALVGLGSGYWYISSIADKPLSVGNEPQRLVLERGGSLASLSVELDERGLIDQPWRLRLYGRLTGDADRLQAGEYRVDPGMDVGELMSAMDRGDVVQYKLTLVEGWRFERMLQAIQGHEAVRGTLKNLSSREIMARLGAEDQHPEGWFLPQTYHFPRGTTDKQLLRRAHEAMERVLDQAWQQRQDNLPLDSPYEALILASIIEKETAVPQERRRIAGVFVRRLRRGMRLQTDPTVIYGMGERYDGNITRQDLKRDTAYNTYTRHGLPPTPIALPGEASVRAAVDPADGKALYFVAKRDGQGHVFSETLEEHNRAVRRHQK